MRPAPPQPHPAPDDEPREATIHSPRLPPGRIDHPERIGPYRLLEVVVVYPLAALDAGQTRTLQASSLEVLPFVIAFDPELALARALGIEEGQYVLPTLVLLDEQGLIQTAYTAFDDAAITAALEQIVVRAVLG